jgi:hypothetical protein
VGQFVPVGLLAAAPSAAAIAGRLLADSGRDRRINPVMTDVWRLCVRAASLTSYGKILPLRASLAVVAHTSMIIDQRWGEASPGTPRAGRKPRYWNVPAGTSLPRFATRVPRATYL